MMNKAGHFGASAINARLARLPSCPVSGDIVRALCLILGASVLTAFSPTRAYSSEEANEYEVKAAFLYNFAKFTEWPSEVFSDPNSPIVIGMIGESPLGASLDQIRGKIANGRQVSIKRFGAGQEFRGCHILFIGASEKKRIRQIIASLDGASILTVSEMEGFTDSGGVINLIMESGKVCFEINAGAANRAKLKVSSKLLNLAKRVKR